MHREPVEPGLQGEPLGLVVAIAEGARNGFVDYFFLADGIRVDLLGGLAEIEFALDEALQARQVDIDVAANVLHREMWGLRGAQGVLEGPLPFRTSFLPAAPARELMRGAQQILVARDLA